MLKKTRKSMLLLALTAAVVMLTGCPGPNDPSSDPTKDGNKDSSSSGLPVIQIQTTNPKNPERPLAFVTDPISDSVKIHAMSYNLNIEDPMYKAPDPWYEVCNVTVKNKSGTVELDNLVAKVKSRGNYTTTYDKKGIRIKFDKKQSVLGMHDGKKFKNWVLLAEWKDFSMVRDYASYNLMRLINDKYYASDSQFVEVYINEEYWGVYLLVEQQEAKRVEITEPEDDKNITDTDIGYLLEFDAYAGFTDDPLYRTPLVAAGLIEEPEKDYIKMDSYGIYNDVNGEKVPDLIQYYTIKSDYNDACKNRIKGYMDNLWTICRKAVMNGKYYEFNSGNTALVESSAASVEECVSKVIDIDSLVATVIQQEIVCDLDLQWSSFYMDVDLNPANPKKLTFEAPWDFDSSYGNHQERQIRDTGNPDCDITHLVSVTGSAPCRGNPWTIIFAGQDWFQDKVRAKWAEMNKANVKGQLITMINDISNSPVYKDAFERNYERWGNIGINVGNELTPDSYNVTTQRQAADYVINFINQRWSMLDKDFETFQSSNNAVTDTDEISYTYKFADDFTEDTTLTGKSFTETLSVVAKADGLHITRTQGERWTHLEFTVYDKTEDKNLAHIAGDDVYKQTEYFYPYVKAGHIYSIWLVSQTDNYKGWHSTEWDAPLKVKAKGGLGNIYITSDDFSFDKEGKKLIFTNYVLEKPSSAVFTSESYTGTLFTGKPWAAGVTAAYGPSFTQSQSGSDTIFTVTDNVWDDALQANNPEFWKDKAHGGIIFNYEFTDEYNHYLIQLLSNQLW